MRIFSTVLASLCVSQVTLLSAQSTPQNVDLKSSDGTVLKATYFSPGKPGPGMVLFHQCSDGATRHLSDSFAKDLVSAGIHVITFDNRGFGETAGRSGRAALPPPPPPPSAGAPPLKAQGWGASPFPIATHIRNTPSLAVFVAYADQDMRDSPVKEIAPFSKNPQTTVRAYPGTEHGVGLLAKQPELRTTFVKWLTAQLK
jgi:hypothetical protein